MSAAPASSSEISRKAYVVTFSEQPQNSCVWPTRENAERWIANGFHLPTKYVAAWGTPSIIEVDVASYDMSPDVAFFPPKAE